jgi:NAD-dependent oxidoreductase involved in siderophore biosynthesis
MRLVNELMRWVIGLVLAGGLVWAVVVWRSRRRTAALVAVACALQLVFRVLWMPGARLLFGPLSHPTNSVQHFFNATASTLYQLSLAVSLGLLVYAALDPANRRL